MIWFSMMSTRIFSSSVSPPAGQVTSSHPGHFHTPPPAPESGQPRPQPYPLTHVVLARDVAQDGVALGDPVLAVHEVGQLEAKGDMSNLPVSWVRIAGT